MSSILLHTKKDVKHFHKSLKTACDKHDKSYYQEFKKWCDKYFVITHRNECRGVGGIFFDDLEKPSQEKAFEFVRSCANSILPGYIPMVEKNKNHGYGLRERLAFHLFLASTFDNLVITSVV